MEKLTLDLDALAVESFAAAEPVAEAGTVLAHNAVTNHSCPDTYCCHPYTRFGTCTC